MDLVTGVFTNNRLEFLHEDADDGIDLNYEGMLDEFEAKWSEVYSILDDVLMSSDLDDLRDHAQDMLGNNNCERGDMLIGFMECMSDEAWFGFEKNGKYFKPDPDAEYSAIVGEVYTQVVLSKWYIECHHCSPCYPGQGDADTPGNSFNAYSLPPEVCGEEWERYKDIRQIGKGLDS